MKHDWTTYGDDCELECPWCSKSIRDLWDIPSLRSGCVVTCDHCENAVQLVSVDRDMDIVATRHSDSYPEGKL